MTLDQIANQVCTKVHDTSSGAVAAAKTFAKNRYEMIWNSQVWKDSLATTSVAVSADDSVVTIPSTNFDMPVAVKLDTTAISPANYESAFVNSPESFTGSGTTAAFVILAKNDSGQIRLQLLKATSQSGTLNVLCKTKVRVVNGGVSSYRSLEQDSDQPAIPHAEQALVALVEADMLEYKQAYAKAQAKQSEALTLLALARNMERGQSASRLSISVESDGQWQRDDWESGDSQIQFI